MKLSLVLTLLICAGFGLFHYRQQTEISVLRRETTVAREAVTAAGLDPDQAARGVVAPLPGLSGPGSGPAGAGSKADAEARAARDREIKELARDIIEFATEMDGRQNRGEPDNALKQRMLQVMTRFLALDAEGMEAIVAEFRAADGIKPKMREEMVGGALMFLSQSNPAGALQLLTRNSDLLPKTRQSRDMAAMCVAQLAAKDPAAAAEWVRKNESNAELVTDDVRQALALGLAKSNPSAALQQATNAESDRIANAVGRSARTPAERTAALEALREQATASPEKADHLKRGVLTGLGQGLADTGFSESTEWVKSATLTPEELATVAAGIASSPRAEPGPWLSWMQENLPPDQLKSRVDSMIPMWASRDFNAVGTWLNDQPEGALRETATLSFASTLAPHEPAAAAQWATTLPDTPDRTSLLRRIHDSWKTSDPDAAAAFADQHRIPE